MKNSTGKTVNFGDILDQWDNQTAKPQGKRSGKNRGTTGKGDHAAPGQKKAVQQAAVQPIHPLTAWLGKNDVYDKDAEEPELHGGKAAVSAGEKRRRLLLRKPDAVIDLHGLTRDEAWAALDAFFEDAGRRGFPKLAIIHGKGNHSRGGAILKHTVREFIERCPFAGESGFGDAASGGSGTTWVLLK
ncbi:DNA mismatch repair protein MutS [Spirochaetia bacterium]|nr:DNA mismatch repair protein MutS [Spirochaetia bacterium]